ncbi:MepB family protein [Paeniglutamicibacter sp. NPDC091659]|uniref:MepB family protein n=1 Tax=Paeniglutamicibacter sp. NPDC091659 TaxID=3364389 RepID=UPI00382AE549
MPHRTSLVPPALAKLLAHAPLPAGQGVTGYFPDPNPEARAYSGCSLALNGAHGAEIHVVFRSAKVTPTKAGLFVTLWQRDAGGVTRPYTAGDDVDEFWIAAETKHGYGCFKFPAHELAKAGILATAKKPGKRGFRLYTPWDTDLNAGATKAWAWQRGFFTVLSR